jgi:hypothetical protein
MKKHRRILLVAGTHGDEPVGLRAIKRLKRTSVSSDFDFIIGNPEACAKNVRFIDIDLNRCAPGDLKSDKREERRAAEILEIARPYEYMLDLHGAKNPHIGIFSIISNPTPENLGLALNLNVNRIIIWPGKKESGPCAQFLPRAIGIECGNQLSGRTARALSVIVRKFSSRVRSGNYSRYPAIDFRRKKIFFVEGKLIDEAFKEKLADFQKAEYKGKEFYPLLSNQYPGINCYMMKRVETEAELRDIFNDPWKKKT